MHRALLLMLGIFLATSAQAGMPSGRLNDFARMRLETISFFVVVFLVACGAVMGLWNWLRKDLPWLPRLTYGKSLGLVGLWGFLFILVLTMISGARELMTPGAWEPNGATYKLKAATAGAIVEIDPARCLKLAELKAAIWDYARRNEGRLPADIATSGIALASWQMSPAGSASPWQYSYIPGRKLDSLPEVLVEEPLAVGGPRLMLLTDGRITRSDSAGTPVSDGKGKP